jgi:hypothetical protein
VGANFTTHQFTVNGGEVINFPQRILLFSFFNTVLVTQALVLNSISLCLRISCFDQDVTMKVMPYSQQGSRAICILSATGSISNVTLGQPTNAGGTLTYEVTKH